MCGSRPTSTCVKSIACYVYIFANHSCTCVIAYSVYVVIHNMIMSCNLRYVVASLVGEVESVVSVL